MHFSEKFLLFFGGGKLWLWLILLVSFTINFQASYSQDTKPKNKDYKLFPDEFSELDDFGDKSRKNDQAVLITLEKARQQYVQALIRIEKGDTTEAALYFEQAMDILNRLVSYPGIEDNEEFTDLAQSVVDDYESFVPDFKSLSDNSSIFIIRDKLYHELDSFYSDDQSDVTIGTIEIPRDTVGMSKAFAGLPVAVKKRDLTIPLDDNKYVQKNIEFLTQHKYGKKFMAKCLSRTKRWLPLLLEIADEEEAPFELVYLSMVESGLNPNAISRAKAVGMWQFISSTGKDYGLNSESSFWVDERRDPEKATVAAMRHLSDLYNEFGNWHLALAAYNCGAGCVKRAIRKSNKTNPDFWEVQPYLPRETKKYVPLFIAMTRVAMDPAAYGFDLKELEFEEKYEYEIFNVSESVNLASIAKCAGVPEETIKNLNPELVRSFTPPNTENYSVKVPVGTKDLVANLYPNLTDEEKRPWIFHKVERKESLSSLAKIYGVSSQEIAAFNGLRSSRSSLKTGAILKIPGASINPEQENTQISSIEAQKQINEKGSIIHIVQPGENLYRIAQHYGVRLTDLRNLNDISVDDENIQAGMKLIVAKSSNIDTTSLAINKLERPKIVRHKVKRGETLGQIADEYGVTVAAIRNENKISNDKIVPGQILKIISDGVEKRQTAVAQSTEAEKVVHKVRSGESIGTIAARYGVRESDLKKWNADKIDGSTIYKGTYLNIYPDQAAKGSSSVSKKVNRTPKYYKVRKGDTFGKIAAKFGLSVSSLEKKNRGVNPNRLQIGQRIRIQ